jgi:hypothetical protein
LSRRLAWLAVAGLTAMAVAAPSAAPALALTGAIYTSNFDGSIINENTGYAAKTDVYLTGGPCSGGSHLANGDYYYEVTSPNGVLLSSDAIGQRYFTVLNGFIQTSAGHVTHVVNCNPAVVGITVQLYPFDDTPNPGGEYKLTVATADSVEACRLFSAGSSTFEICTQADQKTDNFKVEEAAPTPVVTPAPTPVVTPAPTASVLPTESTNPTPTPVVTPAPTPVVTPAPTASVLPTESVNPTPAPTGTVGGATGTPGITLPPTDTLPSTGAAGTGSDGLRFAYLMLAAVMAAVALINPVRARRRVPNRDRRG